MIRRLKRYPEYSELGCRGWGEFRLIGMCPLAERFSPKNR